MSSLVKVQYWRAPTTCQYSVGSFNNFPSWAKSLGPETVGVAKGRAPIICVLSSSSEIYLDCLRWSPSLLQVLECQGNMKGFQDVWLEMQLVTIWWSL